MVVGTPFRPDIIWRPPQRSPFSNSVAMRRLLALDRNKAEIEGSLHQNGAMIARARQSILELEA